MTVLVSGNPAARATAATVPGASPRHDLQVDALLAQVRDHLGRLGAHPLAQHGEAERREAGRRGGHVARARHLGQRRRPAEHEHPRALALAARHLGRERPGAERLGRAEDQHLVVERRARPLPPGRERHLAERRLRRAAERRGDRVATCPSGRCRRPPRAPGSAGRPPRGTPGAGTTSISSSVPSVSVPVLSRQTVSTDASDSIAFSCWASAPARAMRTAPAANVTDASSTSPSGTIEMRPAVAVCARLPERGVVQPQRGHQDDGQRHHRDEQQAQQLVDLELERREPALGGPRLGRQLAGVRVGADRRDAVQAGAAGAVGAGQHVVAAAPWARGRTRR